MKTTIELNSMCFFAFHGVNPQEKLVGNHFIVDLTLIAPLEKAVASDDLSDTINYADVYATVNKEMAISSSLLEHVAGRILKALKSTFPEVTAAKVKITKLNPPLAGELKSASFTIEENF